MAQLLFYQLEQCGTCRKARQWLDAHGIAYTAIAVRQQPPTTAELDLALQTVGNIRKLLNTSSQDYRAAGLKDRLDTLSNDEVFALLQANGNLVKRPFVVTDSAAWAGFQPEQWQSRLL
jgi:arsenate reductase